MTVGQISALSSARAPASAGASSTDGNYNAFLQLLVTELRNQDPTKPLDPTQTVTQLATFSQVQQTMQTNALLAGFAENSSLFQASALIGRTISAADGSNPGVVKSVTVTNNGLVAILDDGRQMPIGVGIQIS